MNHHRLIRLSAVFTFIVAAVAFAESPDVSAALADRKAHFQPADYQYIQYLTLAPHVGDEAIALERALKLVLPSTSTQPVLDRCTPTHIGGGVFRVDLRDMHWRPEDWFEVTVRRNPYTHDEFGDGVCVVRADWFVQEISDQQESDSYLRLLFGGDNLPKNIDDVRKFFHVDNTPELRFGMIVGQSGVNKQGVRWMESRPISRGYYWQTFDSLKLDKDHDPIEHPDGSFAFDGSEIIVGMPKLWLGDKATPGSWGTLQAYFLTNGKNEIVARAPVDLVSDSTKFRGYDEIRNPGSCIQCHLTGLNVPDPKQNEFRNLIQSGVDVYAGQGKKEALERFHLSGLIDDFSRANDDFQAIVSFATGCEKASDAIAGFKSSVLWYDQPLGLEQTAAELGTTVEKWTATLATTPTLPARFASLAHGGKVPRAAFEQGYLASYDAVNGIKPINQETPKAETSPKPAQPTQVVKQPIKPAAPKSQPPSFSNGRR